jgi:hypothetical protein
LGGQRATRSLPIGASKLVKMVGTVNWCATSGADHGQITRAILRDDRTLVLDMRWGGYTYSATLTRGRESSFQGVWNCRGAADTGQVIARLYKSAGGDVILGEWSEEGRKYHWWAELTAVSRFDDEEQDG